MNNINNILKSLITTFANEDYPYTEIFISQSGHQSTTIKSLALVAQEIRLKILKNKFEQKLSKVKDSQKTRFELIITAISEQQEKLDKLNELIKQNSDKTIRINLIIKDYLKSELTPFINKLITNGNFSSDEKDNLENEARQKFEAYLIKDIFNGNITEAGFLLAVLDDTFAKQIKESTPQKTGLQQIFHLCRTKTTPENSNHTSWSVATRLDSRISDSEIVLSTQIITITTSGSGEISDALIACEKSPTNTTKITKNVKTLFYFDPIGIDSEPLIPKWFKDLFVPPGILGLTKGIRKTSDAITQLDLCIVGTNPGVRAEELLTIINESDELKSLEPCKEIQQCLNLLKQSLMIIKNDVGRIEFTEQKRINVFSSIIECIKEAGINHFLTKTFNVSHGELYQEKLSRLEVQKQRAFKLAEIEIKLWEIEQKTVKKIELEEQCESNFASINPFDPAGLSREDIITATTLEINSQKQAISKQAEQMQDDLKKISSKSKFPKDKYHIIRERLRDLLAEIEIVQNTINAINITKEKGKTFNKKTQIACAIPLLIIGILFMPLINFGLIVVPEMISLLLVAVLLIGCAATCIFYLSFILKTRIGEFIANKKKTTTIDSSLESIILLAKSYLGKQLITHGEQQEFNRIKQEYDMAIQSCRRVLSATRASFLEKQLTAQPLVDLAMTEIKKREELIAEHKVMQDKFTTEAKRLLGLYREEKLMEKQISQKQGLLTGKA